MAITIGTQLLQALLFGAFFSGLYHLIRPARPWVWREWLAGAVVLAGLAYIILFGLVQV